MSSASIKKFPIEALLIVYENNVNELDRLKLLDNNKYVSKRIKELEYNIKYIKNTCIDKYLDSNISLSKCAKLLISTNTRRKDIYQELFTNLLICGNGLISLDLLNSAINELDIEYIMQIISSKKTGAREIALDVFDKIIFNVDEDVYGDYLLKKKLDY